MIPTYKAKKRSNLLLKCPQCEERVKYRTCDLAKYTAHPLPKTAHINTSLNPQGNLAREFLQLLQYILAVEHDTVINVTKNILNLQVG